MQPLAPTQQHSHEEACLPHLRIHAIPAAADQRQRNAVAVASRRGAHGREYELQHGIAQVVNCGGGLLLGAAGAWLHRRQGQPGPRRGAGGRLRWLPPPPPLLPARAAGPRTRGAGLQGPPPAVERQWEVLQGSGLVGRKPQSGGLLGASCRNAGAERSRAADACSTAISTALLGVLRPNAREVE